MARRRSNSGRVLDTKFWSQMNANSQSVSTNTTVLSGGTISFAEAFTILRCRGYVQASMDATKQVDDHIRVIFGLGIVSTDAATLGATAMPDPGDEANFPWLWWGSLRLRSYVAAGAEAWGMTAQRLEVDTKAMRRVKPGQSLVWIAETASVTGAVVTNIDFGETRVLVGQ